MSRTLTTFSVHYVTWGNADELRLIDARSLYDARKRASEYPDCYLVIALTVAPKHEQGTGDKPAPGDHDYVESTFSWEAGVIVGCFIMGLAVLIAGIIALHK